MRLHRTGTDEMSTRTRQVLTVLERSKITTVSKHADNCTLDLILVCWRRANWRRMRDGADLAAIVQDHSDAVLAEVALAWRDIQTRGLGPWLTETAEGLNLTVAQVLSRFAEHHERWQRRKLEAPNDWAFVARAAHSVATGVVTPAPRLLWGDRAEQEVIDDLRKRLPVAA